MSEKSLNNKPCHDDEDDFESKILAILGENPDKNDLIEILLSDAIVNLQASFSDAIGIPSVLATPTGKPLSIYGDFGKFCKFKSCISESGRPDCLKKFSDLNNKSKKYLIHTCSDSKMTSGGTGIFIGELHLANWIIGQVRNEQIDEERVRGCAIENGTGPEKFIAEYKEIPIFNKDQFENICKFLHNTAKLISRLIYTNIKQRRSINEKEEADKKLIASEKRYKDIFENVSDWIYTHDVDGNFLDNNLHFIKALGYSAEELINLNIRDLMPIRFRPFFDDYLKKILQAGSDSGLMKIIAADNRELIIEYNNILVQNNDETYIQGLSRDITSRFKTEKALKESEKKFRSILENIQEGYYEVDIYGNFTFFNNSLCKTMGYSSSEMIGMNNQHYMDEKNAKKVFDVYNKVFTTGIAENDFEFELVAKDGRKIHIQSSVNLILSPKGKPLGYRGITRDITEKKRYEKNSIEQQKSILNARAVTIMGLAKLSEYRDNDAGAHLERMREFSKIIAEELAKKDGYKNYITPLYVNDIYQSAILHDIGKVGVPDAVLLKPGKLTDEEFEIIKEHAALGGDAIKEIESRIDGKSFLTLAKEIAYFHHEKWNGSGYPNKLKGNKIPLSARIVAIADVYDALTSERIYKKAFSHEKAVEIITSDSGKHFAPDIVEVFIERNKDFKKISKRMKDPAF